MMTKWVAPAAGAAIVLSLLSMLSAPTALAFDQPYKVIEGGAWDIESGPIPYVLEPNGVDDVTDGSDLDALRSAFRAWSCVEGTSVRFEEQPGPGPATTDLGDGKNSLFWDETGDFGLGPATLGVTIGDANPGTKRAAADIVFNGSDSSWSTDDTPTAVDVGSIALHEIGHFLGLDHPCDGNAPTESNCNGPERSVMTPAWGGAVERAPLPDDEEGVKALYPKGAGDTSGCDGPFRKGEKCTCDGDCVDGLVCSSVGDGKKTCAAVCASDSPDCGNGFICALSAPEGNEPAPGVCVKLDDTSQKPPGAICGRSSECAAGTCTLLFDLQRQICKTQCSSDADCAGGQCYESFCVGAASHQKCEEPPPPGCGCGATTPSDAACGAALVVFALSVRRRSRR